MTMRSITTRLDKLEQRIRPTGPTVRIVLQSGADKAANDALVRKHGYNPDDPEVKVDVIRLTIVSPDRSERPYHPVPELVSIEENYRWQT